jgi:hypothetical protein
VLLAGEHVETRYRSALNSGREHAELGPCRASASLFSRKETLEMLAKERFLVSVGLTLVATFAIEAAADPVPAAPQPFGQYLVYSAAGVFDASTPPPVGDLAD